MQLPFVHRGRVMGPGIPRINWDHPLASGLSAVYVPGPFGAGIIPNLAYPGLGDINNRNNIGTGQSPGLTPEGLGVQALGALGSSTTFSNFGTAPTAWQVSSGSSLFARTKKLVGANASHPANIIGLQCTSSPFNCYLIANGGVTAQNLTYNLAYNTSTNTYIGSLQTAIGTMCSLGATFASGAPAILYVNGVADTLGGSPPNVAITYVGTVDVTIGSQATNNNVGATLTVGYIWARRIINPSEQAYLDRNPYSLLIWPSDLIMAELVGTSAVIPPAAPAFKPMLFSPLMVAGGAMEWLGRRKMTMRRLRGE